MILQYFKLKENEYKNLADNIYVEVLNYSKKLMEKNYFKDNNFNISFEIVSIILIFYLNSIKIKNASRYKKINDELIRNFIDDLDKSLRDAGIGDMSIGKYVKKYVKKFYFRIKIIDPVLNNLDNLKLINYLKSIKITNDKNFTELAQDLLIIAKKIKNH